MWCGDCRNVEEDVKTAFSEEDAPTGIIIRVGDISTWKDPDNYYRLEYGLTAIPTIIRLKDGAETGRLVEDEIKDKTKLAKFIDADA